jgi:hypothetical protein
MEDRSSRRVRTLVTRKGVCSHSFPEGGRSPLWVKTGKAHYEHIFSALPLKADIRRAGRDVRKVPNSEVGNERPIG